MQPAILAALVALPGAISSRTKRKRERSGVSQRTVVQGILLPLVRLLNYGIIACLATRVREKAMQRTYPVSDGSPPSYSASSSQSGASVSALYHSRNLASTGRRQKFSSSTGPDGASQIWQGRNQGREFMASQS